MRTALVNSVILNGGDAGIVFGICDAIHEVVGHAEVEVFARGWPAAAAHYPDLTLRPMLQDRWPGGPTLGRVLRQTFPARYRFGGLLPSEKAFFQELYAKDIIVYCGGGYINDLYSTAVLFAVMAGSLQTGKPHMAYAHSVGPFRKRCTAASASALLSRFDAVTTRDEHSLELLRALGTRPQVLEFTADAAFAMTPRQEGGLTEQESPVLGAFLEHRSRNSRAPLLVASVRPWDFPGTPEGARLRQRYLAELGKFVHELVSSTDWQVCFFSTCQGRAGYGIDDAALAHELVAQLPGKHAQKVCVVEGALHPRTYPLVLSLCADAVVSMRMHLMIYSLIGGVPVIPIAYERKTRELARQVGIEDLCLDLETFTADELTAALRRVREATSPLRDRLARESRRLRDRSLENARILVNVYRARQPVR